MRPPRLGYRGLSRTSFILKSKTTRKKYSTDFVPISCTMTLEASSSSCHAPSFYRKGFAKYISNVRLHISVCFVDKLSLWSIMDPNAFRQIGSYPNLYFYYTESHTYSNVRLVDKLSLRSTMGSNAYRRRGSNCSLTNSRWFLLYSLRSIYILYAIAQNSRRLG